MLTGALAETLGVSDYTTVKLRDLSDSELNALHAFLYRHARQNPITGARRNPTTTLAGFANPPKLRKASRGIPPALRNRGE